MTCTNYTNCNQSIDYTPGKSIELSYPNGMNLRFCSNECLVAYLLFLSVYNRRYNQSVDLNSVESTTFNTNSSKEMSDY